MPRSMTRALVHEQRGRRLGKGPNVIVLGLLRPSARRLVWDSEAADRPSDDTTTFTSCHAIEPQLQPL